MSMITFSDNFFSTNVISDAAKIFIKNGKLDFLAEEASKKVDEASKKEGAFTQLSLKEVAASVQAALKTCDLSQKTLSQGKNLAANLEAINKRIVAWNKAHVLATIELPKMQIAQPKLNKYDSEWCELPPHLYADEWAEKMWLG